MTGLLKLSSVHDLDKRLIDAVLKIDEAVYPDYYQGTFDEVHARYLANRDMFLLLWDGEILAGYVCFFPIQTELYDEIRSCARMFDSDIPGASIPPYEVGKTYRLYLISVAILPGYQGHGLSRLMREGFLSFVDDKKRCGIIITSSLATAVTDDGRRFLEKTGFSKINQLESGETLYEISFDVNL